MVLLTLRFAARLSKSERPQVSDRWADEVEQQLGEIMAARRTSHR